MQPMVIICPNIIKDDLKVAVTRKTGGGDLNEAQQIAVSFQENFGQLQMKVISSVLRRSSTIYCFEGAGKVKLVFISD